MCTPIGSMFSIEQTTTQLPRASDITSSSNSCQPSSDSSTSTCPTGLAASPAAIRAASSSGVRAIPPPLPPSVNAGRTIDGRIPGGEHESVTTSDLGTCRPALSIASLKSNRSSARRIASTLAPSSSTPYSASAPDSCSSTARLRAVWPPSVGSSASGSSAAITSVIVSTSSGSMYVASAHSGSVMIVAGFELTSTTRIPSRRSTRQAWDAE